jgi:hypothetical protein
MGNKEYNPEIYLNKERAEAECPKSDNVLYGVEEWELIK